MLTDTARPLPWTRNGRRKASSRRIGDGGRVAAVLEQDDELVATETGGRVAVTQARADAVGDVEQ
jgi:hypothetical protein